MKIDKAGFRKILASFFSITSFIYLIAITFCEVPEGNKDNAGIILGFLLGTTISTLIGYYFGYSEKYNV